MADKQVIGEWVEKAEEDYLFAQKHLKDEKSFFGPLCFHCHQSGEKYLKAYLLSYGWELKKTHDLIFLLSTALFYDPSFQELSDAVKRLNAYYIETRYPTVWPTATEKSDAKEALDDALCIRNKVREALNFD